MDIKHCFVTGKPIPSEESEDARYTETFKAWVSKEGQRLLEVDPEAMKVPELVKVAKEWTAQELDWYSQYTQQQNNEDPQTL